MSSSSTVTVGNLEFVFLSVTMAMRDVESKQNIEIRLIKLNKHFKSEFNHPILKE